MRAEQKHFIFIVICCSFLFAPGGLFINAGGASTVEITARVSLIAYNVTTSGITASTADITWMTNGLTNSTVEYGLTTAYGLSKNNSEMVENHAITLDALSDGQEYHFRVVSSDSADTTCTSPDFTFTTDSLKSAKSKILGGLPVVELMPGPPIKSVVSGNEIPMTAGNRVRDPVDVVSGDRSALLLVGTGTRLLDRDGWVVKGIGLTRIAPGDVPSGTGKIAFYLHGVRLQDRTIRYYVYSSDCIGNNPRRRGLESDIRERPFDPLLQSGIRQVGGTVYNDESNGAYSDMHDCQCKRLRPLQRFGLVNLLTINNRYGGDCITGWPCKGISRWI